MEYIAFHERNDKESNTGFLNTSSFFKGSNTSPCKIVASNSRFSPVENDTSLYMAWNNAVREKPFSKIEPLK